MTCLTCSLSETQMHGNDKFLQLCDHSCQLWGRRPRGAELGRGPVPPGQRGGFWSGHRSHHERHQWQDLPGEHSAGHRHAGGRKPSHPGELVGVSGLQNVQHKHFRGRKASCINETQHSPAKDLTRWSKRHGQKITMWRVFLRVGIGVSQHFFAART